MATKIKIPYARTHLQVLDEERRGNPDIDIGILMSTGFHRATTRAELIGKLGAEIVKSNGDL